VRDATRVSDTLEELGYQVNRFYSEKVPPLDTVWPTFENFFLSLKEGDQAVFYVSSHGTQLPEEVKFDDEGVEFHSESDSMDEAIYVDDDLLIVDDQIRALLQKVPKGVKIALFFDCCHSATAADLPFRYDGSIKHEENKYKFDADIVAISGCKDDSYSFEANGSGYLTASFIQTLVQQRNLQARAHPMKLRSIPRPVETWYDFYLNIRKNMLISPLQQDVQLSFTTDKVLLNFWL
jgi:hypothetical protein